MVKKTIVPNYQQEPDNDQSSFNPLNDFNFFEIVEHLYDGIYVADGEGNTLYVNKSYTRITGINAEEIIGFNVEQLMKRGIFANAVTPEVIRQKKQVNSIAYIPRTNKCMLVTGTPIFDDNGNVNRVVVIDRECSDLQIMQQELEDSRERIKVVEEKRIKTQLEISYLRQQQTNSQLIGQSKAIDRIKKQIFQIADLDVTVLINGETGVGKEVVTNEIHRISYRHNHPLIKINCAAIPASLLEAELFGYEKGAYTGAAQNGKIGLFELADKGTLFLDEIGDMPPELQAKILRVLQHREIYRIGGTKPIPLDVRIIAATNIDLKSRVQKGDFREDLYYRINVFPIHIEPLRERQEDIRVLTEHFIDLFNHKYHKNIYITPDCMNYILHYNWPGNVRELSNIIERLVIVSRVSQQVSVEQLSMILGLDGLESFNSTPPKNLKAILADVERKVIEEALSTYGSTRKAAKALGIDQSTIVKKRHLWQL